MKKEIILYTLMILIFGVLSIIIYNNRESTKITYSFTIDVNPSIKVNVDKDDNVVNIKLLNQNAKDLFDEEDYKGVSLGKVIKSISNKLLKSKYLKGKDVIVLFGIDNKSKEKKVTDLLNEFLESDEYNYELIIPDHRDDARKYSIRYKITEAKASYIISLIEDNNKLKLANLVNKPVDELYNMLSSGLYCDSEYNLKGKICAKKIGEGLSIEKKMCPEGYEEERDACYKSENIILDYSCDEGFTLEGDDCIKDNTKKAATIHRSCPSNYELYENLVCLNYDEKTDFVYNKVCDDDDSELDEDICIQYETKEPYKKGE